MTNKNLIPIENFMRYPKRGFKISPDGKYIIYKDTFNKITSIFLKNIYGDSTLRIQIPETYTKYTEEIHWGNDKKILFLSDKNGDENYHLFAVDIDGKEFKDLTPFDNIKTGIIDELKENDSEILISLNKNNPEVFDAYRLNFLTGELILEAGNPGSITSWIADHNGNVRAGLSTDGLNSSLFYRLDKTQPFKTILSFSFKDSFIPLFFTFDNKDLYASSNIDRDKNALIIFDVERSKEKEIVFEYPGVDVTNLYYSRKYKRLSYIIYTKIKKEIIVLDDNYNFLMNKFDTNKFNVHIIDSNLNEDKFLIFISNSKYPGDYYLYSILDNASIKLSDSRPWLDKDKLSESKPISFYSRDKFFIQGYLTIPINQIPKNLPIIVLVHGGPWWRDDMSYSDELQFLVNRGYAVFQINYRGSTGYGRDFWMVSFKQWGKKMQDDITDGVHWLIKQGIADPKRIAIGGWSYGGYAALAGLAFTPELYKCGFDFYGISNIFTFYKSIPPYWNQYLESLYEMIGHPEKDYELLKEISPIFHVDKIKAPLFIAQGKNDVRVNIKESDQMVEKLRKKGNVVEYIVIDGGHGYWNENNLIYVFKELEKFLEENL